MIFFLWQIFNWLWTWTMPWERWLWSSVPGQKQIRWLSICHQKDPFTQLVMITVLLTILDDEPLLKVEFSALCIDHDFWSITHKALIWITVTFKYWLQSCQKGSDTKSWVSQLVVQLLIIRKQCTVFQSQTITGNVLSETSNYFVSHCI